MKYKLGDITVKNWNDWDNAPRAPVVAQAIGNAILGSLAIQASLAVATAVGYLAIGVVTYWAVKSLSPKIPSSEMGTLFNSRDGAAPQEIVYGEVRKGGIVTYIETTGGPNDIKNRFLHQIICLAGHEVHEIGDIYVNDKVVELDNDGFVDDDRWTDDDGLSRIQILKFTGADDQDIYSTITGASSPIGSDQRPSWQVNGADPTNNEDVNFKGEGIACLYVKFRYDTNIFADGVPLITAKVKGKKVYDPRTSTTAYSANAALCVRDYITSTYGLDNDGDTDDAASASFDVAADVCDETVNLAATDAGSFIVGKDYTIKTVGTTDFTGIGASANTVGTTFTATGVGSGTGTAVRGGSLTEKRYEINGVISLDRTPSDILADMMTACAGTLFWGAGLWHLKVGDYVAAVKTFTLDDLRSEITLQTKHSRRDNFNIVRGTFIDAENRYLEADYPEIRSETFISDDGDVESALDFTLPLTTSSPMAQRLAKMTLFRAREQMTFTADFSLEAFEVECGDNIALTIDRYGWSAKEFEVIGWKLKNGGDAGDLRVALTLRETSSAAFSWSAEEADITSNNSTLPDPRAGLTITNLSVSDQNTNITTDGTHTVTASLDWDDVDNAYVNHYLVGLKNNTTGIFNKSTTDASSFETGFLVDGDSYTFVVAAVTDSGYMGQVASVTFTAEADTTAPSAPTSVSGSGGYRSNFISWTNPTDDDLKEIQVYVNTSNTSTGATLLGTTAATEFVHGGLSQSTTRYYFLKAVDYTGNSSGFSSGTGAVTTQADPTSSTGATGASTNIIFKRATSASAPSSSSGVPTGWSDTVPTGTNILWASVGTKAVGSSVFVWNTPFKAEGTSVVEVVVYRKNNNAGASGGSYNFSTQTLTTPTGWSQDAPSLSSNGDVVYRISGIASGAPTETSASITWSSAVVYARRVDGTNGVGDTGARYATVRYYQSASSTPSTSGLAAGVSYTWSTATATSSFTVTADSGVWTTTSPSVDAAGTNEYYVVDVTFIDSTGEASTSSGSAVTTPVSLFNFNGLVTFTNASGTTTLQDALDDNSTTIDGGKITTNSIEASSVKIDGLTLDTNASNQLIIKAGGVDTAQIAANAISQIGYQNFTNSTYTVSSAFTTNTNVAEFTFATVSGVAVEFDYNLTFDSYSHTDGVDYFGTGDGFEVRCRAAIAYNSSLPSLYYNFGPEQRYNTTNHNSGFAPLINASGTVILPASYAQTYSSAKFSVQIAQSIRTSNGSLDTNWDEGRVSGTLKARYIQR